MDSSPRSIRLCKYNVVCLHVVDGFGIGKTIHVHLVTANFRCLKELPKSRFAFDTGDVLLGYNVGKLIQSSRLIPPSNSSIAFSAVSTKDRKSLNSTVGDRNPEVSSARHSNRSLQV